MTEYCFIRLGWRSLFLPLLLIVVVQLAACAGGRGRVETATVRRIDQTCYLTDDGCRIDLKFIDWVDWDTMVVFPAGTDDSEIRTVLKTDALAGSRPPISIVIALTKDGKVVYMEDDPRSIEGYDPDDVEFEATNPAERYSKFGRDAVLEVHRRSLRRDRFYYGLYCVNCGDSD